MVHHGHGKDDDGGAGDERVKRQRGTGPQRIHFPEPKMMKCVPDEIAGKMSGRHAELVRRKINTRVNIIIS